MFIEINNVQYNINTFNSFASRTEQMIEGSEIVYKYYIIYEQTNSGAVVEQFDNSNDRDRKYNKLIELFGIDVNEEQAPSVE